jgi:hypothetical protein
VVFNVRLSVALLAGIASAAMLTMTARAFTSNGPSWAAGVVDYYVNAANLDLVSSAAAAAVRAGADTWDAQTTASFRFSYAGPSPATSTGYDGTNLVVFRNASSGSAIATTYWWYSGTRILDADIVFWDGAFRFFSGTSGCSGGFYVEDIAAHEFGHALGLGHSSVTSATMYASTSYCSTQNRLLDADDIAGVLALYPPPAVTPPLAPVGLRITVQGDAF